MYNREEDRVESIRAEIRAQRVAVGDQLERIIEKARGRLDVVGRARRTISERPLPFLGGGFAIGFAIGLTAPDIVAGIARAAWGSAKVGARVLGPLAIVALAMQERKARLRRACLELAPPLEGGPMRRRMAPPALGM